MEKILVINPAIASANLGDFIIEEVTQEYIKEWFSDAFITDIPSHTPIDNLYFYSLRKPTLTLVTGTNLLQNFPYPLDRQWDIKISDLTRLNNVTLFGTGWRHYRYKPHLLTPWFYKKLLHPQNFHSVRDEFTKLTLEKMGFNNVLNTACPTMWKLTPEFNQTIPTTKASRVVTTLTDYAKDVTKDKLMLETLKRNYDVVYLWCQGTDDYQYYLKNFFDKGIIVLNNSLKAYKDILSEDDLDYVGSRLHGGIYALRHQKRTIILAVDNRALEIHKDTNLPVLAREQVENLEELIQSSWPTIINLPQESINKFISQFKK